MSPVKYATKEDIERLERKIDNLTHIIKIFIEEEITGDDKIIIEKRLKEIKEKKYDDYEEFVKKELNIDVWDKNIEICTKRYKEHKR